MVPIHVDALLLEQDRAVVDAMADFTQLPYFDGARDVNSDTGYLSEAILGNPFANQDLRLPAGVHLHWALPDALTRAKSTADGLTFPVVPNRWMVLRSRAGAAEPYEKAWVVDSDYLHPSGSGAGTGSVAYPIERPPGNSAPPFRYLGRVVPLQDWVAQDPAAEHLGALTAVGYGEPMFAAFYPNCRNVFGLHDGDYTAPQEGLRYDVVGWYGDSEQDYLLAAARLAATVDPAMDPMEAIKQTARWTVDLPSDQPLPSRMLCYARLTFTSTSGGGSGVPTDSSITVAVGNTGAQALCAYLADAIGETPQSTAEDQLAAMLLVPQLEQGGLDLDARFKEALHETGFVALAAGTLWTLRQQATGGSAADAAQAGQRRAITDNLAPELVPAVDRLNHALNALNLSQQDYDRATEEIGSLSEQLFADWYRYVLCAYPPVGSGEDYPDIDGVKNFIERGSLPQLKARIGGTGLLEPRQDASGTSYPVALDDNPDSRATTVARSLADVRATLDTINASKTFTDAAVAYRLQQVEAPRFWEPTEPVVLLAGEAMTPTVRHGQDGRLRDDGLLDCQVVSGVPVPPDKPDQAAALIRVIDELAPPSGDTRIGFQTGDGKGWHALLMSWEVEVLPTVGPDHPDPRGRTYGPGFLTGTHALADDEPELRLREGQGVLRRAATVYSGTSILTPHAQDLHIRRLSGYVMGIYQREHQLPALSEEDAATYLRNSQNLELVRAWLDAKPTTSSPLPDPVDTALRALRQLQATPSLSQSLGGFNEALLARKQTLQLAVADPLGFDDYRPFTDTVRKYVQGTATDGDLLPPYLRGHNRSAPQPANDFNPIRSGALRLSRLRLLDTFGRVLDPQWNRVLATRQMPVSTGGDLITLPPRLVQPARLTFRWLSADIGDQQLTELASETPICGWVLANHLEESLMFHGAEGSALGSIDRAGRWQFAPGAAEITPAEIPDRHLSKLIGFLLGRGAAFLRNFHGALDSALENIDPENIVRSQDVALLIGRPLAVVRASLNLELQGLPAVNQGWNELRADLRRDTRETNGFTGVQVPVRIGDYRRLNDGLVGYWKEAGETYEEMFYAPLSEPIDDPSIQTHAGGEVAIQQSLDSPPQVLTMLIDPRGAVHATCGVLPVKTIDIPPEQYAEALRRIEVTFVSGPILTPAQQLGLPLPPEPGYGWSWVERTATGWRETWPWPTIERQAFQDGLAMQLWERLTDPSVRWLRPIAAQPVAAELVPAQERGGPLSPLSAGIAATVEQIFQQYQSADATITLTAFQSAAVSAISRPAWDQLRDGSVGWLDLTAPTGTVPAAGNAPGVERARVTVGEAGSAQTLGDPLAGMETIIRSTLDLHQRRIVQPSPEARPSEQQQVREGWLKLRRLE
jgi:hypothetical protein